LNVTSDEAVSTWEYSLDGATNQTFDPNTTLIDLSDGVHQLDVYATDSSGNIGSDSVSFTVDVTDSTPPTSSDNWTASGLVDKSETIVELTASDDDSGVANITYWLNGQRSDVTGSSVDVSITTEGNNSLVYRATDNAGNVESNNTEYVALDTPPNYKNLVDNITQKIKPGVDVNISASVSDRIGLEKAVLYVNNTGSFERQSFNYTGKNIDSQTDQPTGIAYSSDGTKLFETGFFNKGIYEYSCTEAYSIETCSYSGTSIGVQDNNPNGIVFSDDGTSLFEVGADIGNIYEYSCSTGYDLSS